MKYLKKFNESIVDKISYFSDGKYGDKERDIFTELWNNRLDSKKRSHFYESEESDEIFWEDLLLDLKRDMGEFTNIKGSDFKYLTEWLESKIVNKKITH